MKIKNYDFVEIEYNAYDEQNNLFDTTNEEVAKKNNSYSKNTKYGPVIICIGLRQVIKGLDQALVDKDAPSEFSITIPAENAFGKKSPQLLKLISKSIFTKHKINPVPNLQVNIDGAFGTIKTVSGGRIIVDFNHPMSGKAVKYEVKINKIIENTKQKIDGLLDLTLNTKSDSIDEDNEKITVKIKSNFNQEILNNIAKKLSEILSKSVSIVVLEK